jgi:hypothetical protein
MKSIGFKFTFHIVSQERSDYQLKRDIEANPQQCLSKVYTPLYVP